MVTNIIQHKHTMLTSLLALGLAALAYALPSVELVHRGDGPDPSQVYFESIVWNGSGCPAGSTGNYTSPDGQTLVFKPHDHQCSIRMLIHYYCSGSL